jgi:hypothetical protein
MLPLATILHPTDFSAHSDLAFRVALVSWGCNLA